MTVSFKSDLKMILLSSINVILKGVVRTLIQINKQTKGSTQNRGVEYGGKLKYVSMIKNIGIKILYSRGNSYIIFNV